MALDMYKGKTGYRLIARLPTDPAQLATVKFCDETSIQVYAPEGVAWNGYPALSPVIDSLPSHIADVIQHRMAAELATGRNQQRSFEKNVSHLNALEVTDRTAADTMLLMRAPRTLEDYGVRTRRISRPPILTSVGLDRELSLRLPKTIYGDDAVHILGVVLDIKIHPLQPVGA